MLRTRLWMGTVLVLITLGVLFGDSFFPPWCPSLMLALLALGVSATGELLSLLPSAGRPARITTTLAVLVLLFSNWYPIVAQQYPEHFSCSTDQWYSVVMTATLLGLAVFALEMARYRTPGHSVPRIAYSFFVIGYLGVLPCFFVKLRWLRPEFGGLLLALVIVVPKMGDIAAYFTGRAIGRTPFSPWLSPKKTWEGVVGGLTGSILAALGLWMWGLHSSSMEQNLFRHGVWEAVLFGLLVGIAGVLGDLAESLIKRDSLAKDASKNVPGFGGILDVVDSVLFAAPVVYLWYCR